MEFTSPINGQVFASKQDYITQVMIAYITKTKKTSFLVTPNNIERAMQSASSIYYPATTYSQLSLAKTEAYTFLAPKEMLDKRGITFEEFKEWNSKYSGADYVVVSQNNKYYIMKWF